MNRVLLMALCLLPWMATDCQSDWVLKRDKNKIVIYTRESPGTSLKEYNVSAEIDHPISDVYNFLTDLEKRPDWVIKCTGLEIIDTLEGDIIHYHTSYDIPWPLYDRDLIVEARFSYSDDAGNAHLLTMQNAREYPLKDGIVRMPQYREEVFLEKLAINKTRFRAEGFADPGGNVPAWVVNMFLVDGIYDSIIKTRERVAKNQVPEILRY